MKQHIASLPHHPKRVIVISLAIAITVGTFGYIKINQKPSNLYRPSSLEMITNDGNDISPNQNLTLGFLTGGRIKSVLIKTGDSVKKGSILATLDAGNVEGALTQAKALYATAKANYEKILNGATSIDVTVSSSSVEIAKATLVHSQESLIIAINNSLTSANNAVNNNTNIFFNNPNSENPELIRTDVVFSNQSLENQILSERISLNEMFTLWKKDITGININNDLNNLSNLSLDHLQTIATYIDDLNSLFTLYASAGTSNFKTVIGIDQTNILSARASITGQITTLTNALQTVSSAEKNVEQSLAIFRQKTSSARPEDVAIAEAQVNSAYGTVQIAEAAFKNTIITAPSDGVVLSVSIAPGQIAIPNVSAIEFLSKSL